MKHSGGTTALLDVSVKNTLPAHFLLPDVNTSSSCIIATCITVSDFYVCDDKEQVGWVLNLVEHPMGQTEYLLHAGQ